MRTDPVDRWMGLRPLAFFVLCFLAGALIGHAAPGLIALWIAGALCFLAALIVRRRRVFAFALAMLLGAVWLSAFMIKPDVREEAGARLVGVIDGESAVRERYVRVPLKIESVNGEAYSGRVMLYVYNAAEPFEYGQTVHVTAKLYQPISSGTAGAYDYASWLWRRGIALCASTTADKLSVMSPADFSLIGWSLGLRARLIETVHAVFSERNAGIVAALVAGDKSSMPEEIRESFRVAGVSHLLALSGLHVCVLFACVEWVLRKCRVGIKTAFALSMVFMALYALIVGFPASIVRAGIMYAVGRLAGLSGRARDGLTSLCVALMILLIADPLGIEDAGFILSFLAVAGLLMVPNSLANVELIKRGAYKLKRAFWQIERALHASMAAQLGTMPAMVCLFNQLPVWFLLFNVILIPIMTFIFPALLVISCAGLLSVPIATLPAWPAERVLDVMTAITAWSVKLPYALIGNADWPILLIALYVLALFLGSRYTRFARGRVSRLIVRTLPFLIIALGVALPSLRAEKGLSVVFLDVGQGDAAVIKAEGRVYLMDAGGNATAASYLLNEGLSPDGVFLSHGHADHAAGFDAIVSHFSPLVVYVPCQWNESERDPDVEAAWERALEAGWQAVYLGAGDEVSLSESVVAHVWYPPERGAAGNNEDCLVVSVEYGEAAVLFTGDLPTECELFPMPDCDVLKVAHHGSKYSTGELMLLQTTPSVAVISVGNNNYGHPATEALERLSDVAVYRTDECGAVTVRMLKDGQVAVSTYRDREAK